MNHVTKIYVWKSFVWVLYFHYSGSSKTVDNCNNMSNRLDVSLTELKFL